MTLEIITADSLSPVRHGFFTRKGGASSGIFAGLNCGRGSSDQNEAVELNRNRVAEAMDIPVSHLAGVYQVHSADVVTVTEPMETPREADALVTNIEGIALSILTADCQPILFADVEAGVIGATHAGWKGAVSGVIENTIDAMVTLGAKRESIHAVIGPCISQRAYEVGPEFFETVVSEDPTFSRFFANGEGDRYLFDLPGFGLGKLRTCEIASAEWTRHCTYSDADRFFSYRRATHKKDADYGRLISVIRL